MGCDIHMRVEKRVGGKWEPVSKLPPRPCSWCGGTGRYKPRLNPDTGAMVEPECYSCNGSGKEVGAYDGRNYDLFGMLANVRNGRGFAGCDTGDGFRSIDDPRGLPEDVSPEVRADSDEWGSDGHSHTYFTLAELLAYDWDGQTTRKRGIVSAAEFIRWRERGASGPPEQWCGGISGPKIRTVSQHELEQRIREGSVRAVRDEAQATDWSDGMQPEADGFSYYTQIQWHTNYRDAAGSHWFSFLDALGQVAPADEVRVVIWFDN